MYRGIAFLCALGFSFLSAIEWSAPVNLSDPALNATSPVLHVDYATGQAIAAWVLESEEHSLILASLFDGDAWSEPEILSALDSDADQPAAAINQEGHALVVWRSQVRSATNGIAASFFNGSAWSEPASLSSAPASHAPKVVFYPDSDTAIAVWKKSRGIGALESASFDGSVWAALEGPPLASVVEGFSLCVNLEGTVLLNYIQVDLSTPSKTAAYGAFFQEEWSSPVRISALGDTPLHTASAIYRSADRGGVLWSNLSSIKSSYWNGTEWLEEAAVESDAAFLVYPKIAFDPSSPTMAGVWQSSSGVQGALYLGEEWSAVQTLSSSGRSPALAFHPAEETIYVVWKTKQDIQTAHFNASGYSSASSISFLGSSVSDPSFAIDANGGAFVLWSMQIGGKSVVQIAQGS